MSGLFDRWAARRMLIALAIDAEGAAKSDDEVAIEAFLWRHAGEDSLAETLEDVRKARPEVLEGVVLKDGFDTRPYLWVRIDGWEDVQEVGGNGAYVYNEGDRVECVFHADGHMAVSRNLTAMFKDRAIRGY